LELQYENKLMSLKVNMLHFSFNEFLVICGSTILVALLLSRILGWSLKFLFAVREKPFFSYGYANHNGPHTWRSYFPLCEGENQSPINLKTNQAVSVHHGDDLLWLNYDIAPYCMRITNDGRKVLVTAQWPEGSRPTVSGGPLGEEYVFHSSVFRWGFADEEGSEHTLNNKSYAMELQMIHIHRGFTSLLSAVMAGMKDAVAIICILFECLPMDNPLLDHVVSNLWRISSPDRSARIPPFPLDWVYPPFRSNYYTYSGSLTQPPCTECVTWIIQPEAVAISSRQLAEFRALRSYDGRMTSNMRPVQMNSQDLYFYGSR
jgi:carbonic anhydrase